MQINPADPDTWTLRRDRVGEYEVITSWHPRRFAPAYGLPGEAHHFATVVRHDSGGLDDGPTYAAETVACDGHDGVLGRLRASVEAA